MKKQFLLIFIFSVSLNSQNELSKEISSIVDSIHIVNRFESKLIGEAGVKSRQYALGEKLYSIATVDELIKLTDHGNSVVRNYAFLSLSLHKEFDLTPIMINHVSDTTRIRTVMGCLIGGRTTSDMFLEIYKRSNRDSSNLCKLKKVDSALLYSNVITAYKRKLLRKIEPDSNQYQRIKELAKSKELPEAWIALARFGNNENLIFLQNTLKAIIKSKTDLINIYEAISYYPHKLFYPLLVSQLDGINKRTHSSSGEWEHLFRAIASYKNSESRDLFENLINEIGLEGYIKRTYLRDIYMALSEFNSTNIYDNLIWYFWENENFLSPSNYVELLISNRSKAIELTSRSLSNISELKVLGAGYLLLNIEEKLKSSMLELLVDENVDLAFNIIIENIKNASVHNFNIFTQKVVELKAPVFVQHLFERLYREDNPHIYLNIAKTLVAFENESINQRIIDSKNKNRHLRKDWGGKAFEDIINSLNLNSTKR